MAHHRNEPKSGRLSYRLRGYVAKGEGCIREGTESDMRCGIQFKAKAGCIHFTSNVHEQGPWQDENTLLCAH